MKLFSKPNKAVAAVAAMALGSALVAGCGGGDKDGTGTGSQPPAGSTQTAQSPESQAPPAGAVEVALTEYAFTPSSIEVDAGPVTLHLLNKGVVPHDLVFKLPSGEAHSPQVAPGEQTTWEVGELGPGTYEAVCSLPGHTESGMVGKLAVR